jgi:hypothetical protein
MPSSVHLIEVDLPDFGSPTERPELPPALYGERLSRLAERIRQSGLTVAVVYGDREHFANLSYLSGFDPRFEEALLVFTPGHTPVLITGPENQGSAKMAPGGLDVRLYPPFGLLGQDRSRTRALRDVLYDAGIGAGAKVGVIGWKYFSRAESGEPDNWIDIPSYLADAIRSIAVEAVNATALLMAPSSGLRALNEIDQLAQFEFAATHASEAVKRAVFSLTPGMREYDAARTMQLTGVPLSAHLMLSAGPRAFLGLGSPSGRIIGKGEPFTVACGLWGGLTCRAGFVAASEDDLDEAIRDYVDELTAPYFACAAEWYETIGIGVTGGEIDALVKRRLGAKFFNIFLNPGHLIHLDEWLSTPIYPGSTEKLQSGQAIQLDIIPATGTPYFTSNIEDGIALLDEAGRAAFAERYPGAWRRIEGRRAFMADVLGIRLKPEVLPFSNIAGYLPPFLLSPRRVLARRR